MTDHIVGTRATAGQILDLSPAEVTTAGNGFTYTDSANGVTLTRTDGEGSTIYHHGDNLQHSLQRWRTSHYRFRTNQRLRRTTKPNLYDN